MRSEIRIIKKRLQLRRRIGANVTIDRYLNLLIGGGADVDPDELGLRGGVAFVKSEFEAKTTFRDVKRLAEIARKDGEEMKFLEWFDREFRPKVGFNPVEKPKEPRPLKFKDYVQEWLSVCVLASDLRESEIMTTQSILKYHIIPFFGEMVLGKIGSREIDRYKSKQRQLKHRMGVGYAPKTINNQLSVLHRIFERAVAYKLITENPLGKKDWMKRRQTAEDQMRFLSIAEQQLLIEWMDKNWGEPHPDRRLVVMILLATGIRFSEIRALEKQDVDLAQALLKITRSVARTWQTIAPGKCRELV